MIPDKKILDFLRVLKDNKVYGNFTPILEAGNIVRAEWKVSMMEPDLDKFINLLSDKRRG